MNQNTMIDLGQEQSFKSLWVKAVPKPGWTEYLLGAQPGSNTPAAAWIADLCEFLNEAGVTLVELDIFGDAPLIANARKALANSMLDGFPVSLLIHDQNNFPTGGGLLVRAVAGVPVVPVYCDGATIGFRFEDATAAYCYLGGLVPGDGAQDGAEQTTQVMSNMHNGLLASGMVFRDVVRTWYYLDGILEWYNEFNRARTAFFKNHDVSFELMPSSTGIGIANASGKLVLAKVHAIRPKTRDFAVHLAASPLQGSALSYGSAFSRGLELVSPDSRTLHISGTASIAPGGETEYVDDIKAQIQRTLEVVAAMLQHAGMAWSDAVRGIAYFRHAEDMVLWHNARKSLGLPPQVEIVVHADICRDDLLFELELEAARK